MPAQSQNLQADQARCDMGGQEHIVTSRVVNAQMHAWKHVWTCLATGGHVNVRGNTHHAKHCRNALLQEDLDAVYSAQHVSRCLSLKLRLSEVTDRATCRPATRRCNIFRGSCFGHPIKWFGGAFNDDRGHLAAKVTKRPNSHQKKL